MALSRFVSRRVLPATLARGALAIVVIVGLLVWPRTGHERFSAQNAKAAAPDGVPLAFVANSGQTDASVRYVAQSRGATLFFTDDAIVVAQTTRPATAPRPAAIGDDGLPLHTTSTVNVTRLTFVGASSLATLGAADPLPGRVNYFLGNDPANWRADLPTFATLVYRNLYPGIDLHYQGSGAQIKGTYQVAPGADPEQIRWRYDGASAVRLDAATGDLLVAPTLDGASTGRLIELAPVAWQELGGRRVAVETRFALQPDGTIGFDIPVDYDRAQPLTLDPTLIYATYLGGMGEDNADGVAVDGSGNMYVSGLTGSIDYPTTTGVVQGATAGAYDVYVTKLNAAGSSVVYSTYIGGSGATDYGLGLAVDTAGNAYVTGVTDSTDFPVVSAVQATSGGAYDAFLAKLNPTGTSLLYASYFGGAGLELGFDVAVDPTSGVAYITGRTEDGFPTAGTPYRATFAGGVSDGFVAKVATTLSGAASLPYASYIGGTGEDRGNGLALDAATGTVVVTGRTASTDFPVSAGAFQSANAGGAFDAYALNLNTSVTGAAGLGYSTYLGGNGDDRGLAIARDTTGNLYLTGRTLSTNFPTSVGAPDATCGTDGACNNDGSQSFADAFVVRLNPALSGSASRIYGTYLGGERRDEGEDIVVNSATSEAYLTGYTNSPSFPTQNALQPTCGWGCGRVYADPVIEGFTDAFVTRLNAAGTQLVLSTYLGGNSADFGFGILLNAAADTLYLAGETYATDFPLVSPYQSVNNGNYEVFLLKLDNASSASADLSVTQSDAPDPVAAGGMVTYVMTVVNAGPNTATGVRLSEEIPEGVNISAGTATASTGTCTLIYSAGASCQLGDMAVGSTRTVTVTVNVLALATGPVFTSTVGVASNVSDPSGANNKAVQTTTLTQSADLSVTVADSPDPVGVNQPLTYTIDVLNVGPSIAAGVSLTDTLPAGLTFSSATPGQGTCSGTTTVVCDLGDVWPSIPTSVTLVVTTTSAGSRTNVVSITTTTSDPVPGNNTASTTTTVGIGPTSTPPVALNERLYLSQISRSR